MLGFKTYHPLVNLIYYIVIMIACMAFLDLYVLAILVVSMFFFNLSITGIKTSLKSLKYASIVGGMILMINSLFNHRGSHVLMTIMKRPITLEAVTMGILMALSISAILLMFTSFSEIIDSGKFLYLLSKVFPRTGFLATLTLNFVPTLKRRYDQIRFVREMNIKSKLSKKETVKESGERLLTLIGWSAENAIITADSMATRGFGISKRTSYKTYPWHKRDILFLSISLIFLVTWIYFRIHGSLILIVYPELVFDSKNLVDVCLYITIGIYANSPTIMNLREV